MLNVALIGLGNIGLLYDNNIEDNSKALSHVKALYLHKNFTLKYVIDINSTHLNDVQKFFPNVEFREDYKILINKEDIDVIVIATPTNTHFDILNSFSTNNFIKTFFIEKPLFYKKEDYLNVASNLQNKIIVNYLRRFDKNIIKLKKQISENDFGYVQKVVINYCKGFKNNGSHMIDMVNFLFENPTILSSKILSQTIGFDSNDLTYDIFIQIEYKKNTIPVYFLGLDHTLYNTIEQNIYFEKQIVKYVNSKSAIEYYEIVSDENFSQYKISSHTPIVNKVHTTTLMIEAYSTINEIISNTIDTPSSYNDEVANQRFYETILKDK